MKEPYTYKVIREVVEKPLELKVWKYLDANEALYVRIEDKNKNKIK